MTEHQATPEHIVLARFAAGALACLAAEEPALAPHGRLRAIPLSEGSASHLFRGRTAACDVIVKIRVDASADAAREAWALAKLPEGVGPRLLAHTSPRELSARLAARGRWRELIDVDVATGPVLVLEALAGTSPEGVVPHPIIVETARAIGRLHRARPKSGPGLKTGSSPGALLRLTRDLHGALVHARFVDEATERSLARALTVVERRVASFGSSRLRRVRTLCHGDLRWHNVLVHLRRSGPSVQLVDLEHAGIGDPAIDLALMACRTPLSHAEELLLLDAYLEERRDADLIERYFLLRPLVALLGAVGALVDLADVRDGRRAVAEPPEHYLERRKRAALEEVEDALCGALRAPPSPKLRRRRAGAKPRRRRPRLTGIVALDGTAASGKSVLARAAARAFGVPHFNTGAVYRYATLLALEQALDAERDDHAARLARLLERRAPRLLPSGTLAVGGRELDEALTVFEVDLAVARWARHRALREAIGRVVASSLVTPAIVEGRDVGSVLCPRARRRFFVDADLDARARRVHERLGRKLPFARVRRAVAARDGLDRARVLAPMAPAPGAMLLDTTDKSERESVGELLELLARPWPRLGALRRR